jgi:NADH-quinone oxidoreductase subunit E
VTGVGSPEPAGSEGAGLAGAGAGNLEAAIQRERAKYPPESRSAVLPALRLAQEEYGWLSPSTLREVADALEVTPAYCASIASFYDQLHLAPVGEHLVEVCTNVSCAVVGAQQVVEAFESELGCRAGETTADGKVTLRAVECLGGCGWATIVSIDEHYRTHVKADDVPAIVEELTSGN